MILFLKKWKMGKVAVVTGISGGVGEAIGKTLIEKGFDVFGIDYKKSDKTIGYFYEMDLNEFVKNKNLQKKLFNKVKEIFNSPVELVVNNAAFQYVSSSHPIDYEIMQRTFNVNVFAAYYLSVLFKDDLTKTKGSVINISSIHAKLTKKGFLAYATSKAALSALTRSMSLEFGDKFRINCIEPAAIDTKMLREGFNFDETKIKELKNYHPVKKIASVDEIAKLVYCIHSCEIPFLQGSCIDVSGGISNVLHDPGE